MPRRSLHSMTSAARLFVAAAVLGAAPAQAAGDPDKAKGILVEHCSECHIVPGYSEQGLPTVEAASFQDIADNPEVYTEARVRAFLRQPHWPMGGFRLSPRDIDNIVAYLEALRAQ